MAKAYDTHVFASRPALQRALPWLVAAVGVLVFISIRLQLFADEVPNPDISGILYNADALLRGELPYVDNAEFKPPGSFFLTAASFAIAGRSLEALEVTYGLWLLLGAPAIALASLGSFTTPADTSAPETRQGTRAGHVQAALAVVFYLYYAAMFSYNYTSWMLPAYAWAYAGLVQSLRRPGWTWPLITGFASALATVTMQRAALIGPLALMFLFLPRLFGTAPRRGRVLAGWVVGAGIGALPLAIPYLLRGEVGTLIAAVFPFGVVADYTGSATQDRLELVAALPKLWLRTFPAAWACVALAGVLRLRIPPERRPPPQRALWLFFAASVVGTGLGGGRFYLHYLPQLIPALALLAANLATPALWTEPTASRPTRVLGSIGAAAIALWCIVQVGSGWADRYTSKARRLTGGQSAAQAAGAHIQAGSDSTDTIYGWGWTAWRVYFWADRAAPGRYYKALGTLTTFNTNTAFDPGGDIVFRPGPHAEAFIADFDARPPAYIVLSPSFTLAFGATENPLLQFTALRERIEADYSFDAEFGDLVVLRRKTKAP